MEHAVIAAIEYHLPEQVVSTATLSQEFPDWDVPKIDAKTGIEERHIAGPHECASDLAVQAAKKLFAAGVCSPEQIDFVLFCTQTPDHFLPPTACLLQDRLGISTAAGALDFNLGSSGYVYGLGLANGLITTGQARTVLFLTGDTYSRFVHPRDRSVRTIFGDGATATLITAKTAEEPVIGPFVYGTDGKGGPNLIVPAGGMRLPLSAETAIEFEDEFGNTRSAENVYMNGAEIFTFTLNVIPPMVELLLNRAGLAKEDVDLFVFHQANRYMLEHIRKRMKIPVEKFQLTIGHCANTVSCTIPIALKHALLEGRVQEGSRVMLVGFGVGYSWGATLIRWTSDISLSCFSHPTT